MSDAEERVILMEMLANARADVAHCMAELARAIDERDANAEAARTLAATVELAGQQLAEARTARDTAIDALRPALYDVERLTLGVRRIHLIADTGSTWAAAGRAEVRTIARQLLGDTTP